MATPKKFVHWGMDSPCFLGSPSVDNASESSSMASTSTLEYLNAQLVAHGFAPSPGLCLDGISDEDAARVVKCILGLLSQRMEDMSRTENLTAKYRSLTYDLDRMRSLHRTETEKAANAERETNLYKSRLATSHKNLQACENMQKQTTSELQRTRTLLQGIRATHQSELKKKEKDIERVTEKWQKISDSQYKLGHSQSGLRCANVAVVEGEQVGGRTLGFLDVALEQSEQARNHLKDENAFQQKLILKTVNELQLALHTAQCIQPGNRVAEAINTTTFVPSLPAADKIDGILDSLNQTLSALREAQITPAAPSHLESSEITRLQCVIAKLEKELALSQEQALVHMTDCQQTFENFIASHHLPTEGNGEMSVELMSAPTRDQEKERLEKLRADLDSDRQRFTEAAIKFGHERAIYEAERIRFLEERRSWEFEKMLGDLPATPMSPSLLKSTPPVLQPTPQKKSTRVSPRKSPRKFPVKGVLVGKAGKVRRVSRTSLTPPGEVISYETELIPPPAFPTLRPFIPSSASLLPTSFVLPPPSPRASLPTQPVLPPARFDSPPKVNEVTGKVDNLPLIVEDPPLFERANMNNTIMPATPDPRQSFPVAKPFAQRMIHAYSPARPSPLSRILMLASPTTPPKESRGQSLLSPISEPAEGDSQDSLERVLGIPAAVVSPSLMSTVVEFGDSEPVPRPLFQEKGVARKASPPPRGGRVCLPDADSKKTVEPVTRARTLDEKENKHSAKPTVSSKPVPTGARKVPPATSKVMKAPSKATVKPIVPAKTAVIRKGKAVAKPLSVGGGPRRVPINSVDAPPITKVWKE